MMLFWCHRVQPLRLLRCKPSHRPPTLLVCAARPNIVSALNYDGMVAGAPTRAGKRIRLYPPNKALAICSRRRRFGAAKIIALP